MSQYGWNMFEEVIVAAPAVGNAVRVDTSSSTVISRVVHALVHIPNVPQLAPPAHLNRNTSGMVLAERVPTTKPKKRVDLS
jgi:hypothetical protein